MSEVLQGIVIEKISDRGWIKVTIAGRQIALAGQALKDHHDIKKGDSVEVQIDKNDKGVSFITQIKRSTAPGTDPGLRTQETPQGGSITPPEEKVVQALMRNPTIAECHPAEAYPDPVQRVMNVTELPDSLEIGTPGKGGTIKVYFNSGNQFDAENRIKTAILLRASAATWIEHGVTADLQAKPLSEVIEA